MPSIAEAMTPEAFAELDRQCVAKLMLVQFGTLKVEARTFEIVQFRVDKKLPISWRQRVELYQLCYRLKDQIADNKFLARVLIGKAEADPLAGAERRQLGRPSVRTWAAENPFHTLPR